MKKLTLIDTGGHGYLSVSKKYVTAVGFDPEKISKFSGHDLARVYLEEDCDMCAFLSHLDALGVKYEIKSGYNLKFAITHNYQAKYFDWLPVLGAVAMVHPEKEVRAIGQINGKIIIAETMTGKRWSIPASNPFRYLI